MAAPSLFSPTTPFSPICTTTTTTPTKTLNLYFQTRSHRLFALAAAASSPPPPPPPKEDSSSSSSAADLIKLDSSSGEEKPDSGKLAMLKALEYKKMMDAGVKTPPISGTAKQDTQTNENFTLYKEASMKEGLNVSKTDFLGLEFSDKKNYRGLPPGLAPAVDPFLDGKAREVEIIVGDPSKLQKKTETTDAGSEKEESINLERTTESLDARSENNENAGLYKPKVSTWGVFPRPKNISKAYGGGRNLRPGEALEAPEEKAANEKRMRELIAAYKKSRQELPMDEKTKAQCEKALEEGDYFMNVGKLKQALPFYEKVMQGAPFKSELHGMAALQWSICQDSLCRPYEAKSMYEKLQAHPNVQISKKAKQFMSTFQAMTFMKVDSSTLPRKTGYETYFDAFVNRKDYYTGSKQEEIAGGIKQLTPYLIFLVSPVFIVLLAAIRKSF